MTHPNVAVAVSGGVDSLVAGYLLKQKFRHVFGLHFTTGYEQEPIDLIGLEKQLGFPVSGIDLSNVFEKKVVDYFVQTYLDGKTPNPCIVCNKTIKFGELLKQAQRMGADFLATGHYATVVNPISFPDKKICGCYLERGTDPLKDQSYFLSMLSGAQLEHLIFPLAGLTKTQVKHLAESNRLIPVHAKESQDICFIHDNNFSNFISTRQRIRPVPGNIIDMTGKTVGQHKGLHTYTIGQRRGIDCPAKEPYYVKKIDLTNNVLQVCFKQDLLQRSFKVAQINWNFSHQDIISHIITKIRYGHNGAPSTLHLSGTTGQVMFDEPQNAVTPGQTAVFYRDARVLGAGIIQ